MVMRYLPQDTPMVWSWAQDSPAATTEASVGGNDEFTWVSKGVGHRIIPQQQKPQLMVIMYSPEPPKVLATKPFHNRSLSPWGDAPTCGNSWKPPMFSWSVSQDPPTTISGLQMRHLWISLALLSPPYHPYHSYAMHPSSCTQTSFFSHAPVRDALMFTPPLRCFILTSNLDLNWSHVLHSEEK